MIYLDHHAATPLGEGVHKRMNEALEEAWANPSSIHGLGRVARRFQEEARDAIADAIGASSADVVLCGGGTEACNLGVLGLGEGASAIVSTGIEHPAVREAVDRASSSGKSHRVVDVAEVGASLRELSLAPQDLVAVQWVNHELGTIVDVQSCVDVAKDAGAKVFIDATQALGKLAVDVESLGADAVAFASQKIGGPPGAGALYVKRGVDISPHHLGGSQERGRRAGSPDLAAWAGFGRACQNVAARLHAMPTINGLRDRLEAQLIHLGGEVNGAELPRVATVSNVAWRGWKAEQLVAALDLEGLCVSAGAACSSGMQSDSEILLHMYSNEQWRAGSSIRSSLGIETTKSEIDAALTAFGDVLSRGPTGT